MELREQVGNAVAEVIYTEGDVYWALERGSDIPGIVRDQLADAALAIARPAILEEAAKVAEQCGRPVGAADSDTRIPGTASQAAHAIRALADGGRDVAGGQGDAV